jgi:RimJ/RimL family protein N-acetyltransferase
MLLGWAVGAQMTAPELRTERLILRGWREDDLEPFAALNADPRVMEYFPALLSRAESAAAAARIQEHSARYGFGLWAIEVPGVAAFAGFVGLSIPSYQAHFTPCVEVGWRLARACWGHGYVTEGARAAVRFGFEQLGLEEIVSFTVPANQRSRRVMERLGMRYAPVDDFDHPRIPEGHPLRQHVLYRLARREWLATVREGAPNASHVTRHRHTR